MKKSLLFVNGHLQVGGVEKALVDLLSSIDYEKYDVDLLLLEGEGEYREYVPEQVRVIQKDTRQIDGPLVKTLFSNLLRGKIGNVLYRSVKTLSQKTGSVILYCLRYLLPIRSHYDVAIAFRPGHSAELVAYAVSAKHKFIWWHQGSVPASDSQRQALNTLLSVFDKVVTVSEGCKQLLVSSFNIPDNRFAVVPNIVNVGKLKTLAGKQEPFHEKDKVRIVTVSRFAPEKHLEDAVEAAALLSSKLEFIWYIIGDGCEYDRISGLVKQKGLEERVILPGRIANPYPYIKYAHLMVHPSHVESLCIAVLEAMALEVPCVVVRSLGPESFIKNGRNGILVEKGSEAIYKAVYDVINMDPFQLRSLTTNAVRTVESRFSSQVIFELFERLIDGK